MRYTERVRKNPQSSIVYDIKEKTESSFRKNTSDEQIEFTPRHKLAIGIFGAIFVVMILGIIPWSDKFNITIFEDLHHFIKELPIIGGLIGHIPPLGDWYFKEMTVLFLIGSIL